MLFRSKTQFIFLTRELADRSWCLGDKMIFNADYVLPNGAVAVDKSSEIAYFDLTYKFNKKNCIVDKFNGEQKIQKLEIKKVEFCSPEIDVDYDYSDWKKVGSDTDAFSCDMYDEFIWYKTRIPDNLSEITLSFTGKGGIPRYGVEQRVSGFYSGAAFRPGKNRA